MVRIDSLFRCFRCSRPLMVLLAGSVAVAQQSPPRKPDPDQPTEQRPVPGAQSREAQAREAQAREEQAREEQAREEQAPEAKKLAADPIVITATRLPTAASGVPADVTVMEREDFDTYDTAVVQTLSAVPGIRVDDRPTDNLFGGFEIRGFSTNDTSGANVLILLDGIPQRRLSFGGPYLGMLPFEAIERQELVKGSLGSLYGRGSIAGALQLFSRSGTHDWHFGGRTLVQSTVDTVRGSAWVTGPLGISDGATFSLTAGAKDSGGWQEDTESRKSELHFHGFVPLGEHDDLTVTLGLVNGREDVPSPVIIDDRGNRLPGVARDANLSVPGHNFFDLEEYRASLTWDHRFDDTTRSSLDFGYWSGDTVMFLGRPSNGPAPGSTVVNRLTSERYWEEESFYVGYEFQKELELSEEVEVVATAGLSYEYLSWDNDSRNVRVGSASFREGIPIDLANPVEPDPSTWIFAPFTSRFTDENHVGGFVRTQWDFAEVATVHAGVRYDTYERYQRNRSLGNSSRVDNGAASPAVGVVWHAIDQDGLTLNPYASWSRGFNPVFRAVGNTEIADIEPETSESFEVGVKASLYDGALETTAAVYRIERDDVVAFNSATSNYENSGTWCVQGIELGLVGRPHDRLELYANYTFRSPKVTDNPTDPATEGKHIPLVPEQIAKLGARWWPTSSLLFDVDLQYVGDSYGNTLNTSELPDYLLLDVSASYHFSEKFTATIFGTNLLDEEYFSSIFASATGGAAFEGLPASVGAVLSVEF